MDPNSQNQIKIFTREEANALLPKLTVIIHSLQTVREKILSLEVEIDTLELIAEKNDAGASSTLNKKVDEYTHAMVSFNNLVDEIHGLGCFLKDVDTGLIDFYAMQNNHGVFLCWRLGEEKVEYWHDINTGFTSREKLD